MLWFAIDGSGCVLVIRYQSSIEKRRYVESHLVVVKVCMCGNHGVAGVVPHLFFPNKKDWILLPVYRLAMHYPDDIYQSHYACNRGNQRGEAQL